MEHYIYLTHCIFGKPPTSQYFIETWPPSYVRWNSQVVENAEDDSKQHLPNTQYDGHLHLVGVLKQQLVLGHIPHLTRHKEAATRLRL